MSFYQYIREKYNCFKYNISPQRMKYLKDIFFPADNTQFQVGNIYKFNNDNNETKLFQYSPQITTHTTPSFSKTTI